jgi:hypothetical protein
MRNLGKCADGALGVGAALTDLRLVGSNSIRRFVLFSQ